MLVSTISEHKWVGAAVASISDINMQGSDVVFLSLALWKVNPVASLDLIRLRLSLCCGVGQSNGPKDPGCSSVGSHVSHQVDRNVLISPRS